VNIYSPVEFDFLLNISQCLVHLKFIFPLDRYSAVDTV